MSNKNTFFQTQDLKSQDNSLPWTKKTHDYCFQKLQNPRKRYSQIGQQLRTKNLQFPIKEESNPRQYQSSKLSKRKIEHKLNQTQQDFFQNQQRSSSVILDMPIKEQSRGQSVLTSEKGHYKSYSISDVQQLQKNLNAEEQEKDLKIKNLEQMNHYYRNLITKIMNTTEQDQKNQNIYKSLNQIYFEIQTFEKSQKGLYKEQIQNLQSQNNLNSDLIKNLEKKIKEQEQYRESSNDKNQKFDILQSEINVLNDIIRQKNQEIEKFGQNEKNYLLDSQQKIKQISDLNELIVSKNKTILRYQDQIEELNQNLSQQQKSSTLDQQKNSIQKTTLQNYEKRIYNLNVQIQELQQQIENKDRETQEYKSLYNNLQIETHKSNSIRITEQQNYESLISQVSQLNQEKVAKQTHIQQLTQLLKQKDFQMNNMQKEIQNLKEEITFLEQFQLDQSKVQQSEKFLEILKREVQENHHQNQENILQDNLQQNPQNENVQNLFQQQEEIYKQEIEQIQGLNDDYQNNFIKLFEVMKCFPVDKQQLEELIHKKQDNPQFVLKFVLQQIEEQIEEKDFQINRLQKNMKKKQLQFFEEKEQLQSQLQDLSQMSRMNDKSEKESCVSSNQISEINQQELLKQLQYFKQQNKILVGQNLQLKHNNKSLKSNYKVSTQSTKNKNDSSFLTQGGKKHNLHQPIQFYFQNIQLIRIVLYSFFFSFFFYPFYSLQNLHLYFLNMNHIIYQKIFYVLILFYEFINFSFQFLSTCLMAFSFIFSFSFFLLQILNFLLLQQQTKNQNFIFFPLIINKWEELINNQDNQVRTKKITKYKEKQKQKRNLFRKKSQQNFLKIDKPKWKRNKI